MPTFLADVPTTACNYHARTCAITTTTARQLHLYYAYTTRALQQYSTRASYTYATIYINMQYQHLPPPNKAPSRCNQSGGEAKQVMDKWGGKAMW